MKAALQQYLSSTFEIGDINVDTALAGQVHIRFELGDELENGTQERVEQATNRALTLFRATFENPEALIWVLVYEYPGETPYGYTAGYLYRQFAPVVVAEFYNQPETIFTDWQEKDKNGAATLSSGEGRIIIGRTRVQDINSRNILTAIANTEMGFEPALNERIYFIDPQTNRIFHMYDDRGCLVESNTADSIRHLYQQYNAWIVDYHRPDIDEYFR